MIIYLTLWRDVIQKNFHLKFQPDAPFEISARVLTNTPFLIVGLTL